VEQRRAWNFSHGLRRSIAHRLALREPVSKVGLSDIPKSAGALCFCGAEETDFNKMPMMAAASMRQRRGADGAG
jgi:hypothetical protein